MRVRCVSVAKKRFFVRSEFFVKEERRIDVGNTCWPRDFFIHVFGYDSVTCVLMGVAHVCVLVRVHPRVCCLGIRVLVHTA